MAGRSRLLKDTTRVQTEEAFVKANAIEVSHVSHAGERAFRWTAFHVCVLSSQKRGGVRMRTKTRRNFLGRERRAAARLPDSLKSNRFPPPHARLGLALLGAPPRQLQEQPATL